MIKYKDVTPENFMCGGCPCNKCPAVLETDRDTYMIIGKLLPDSVVTELKHRMADDEFVIEVPKGMIDGLK